MTYNKKFNIRTSSMADLGYEEMEIVLVESIYYAESHLPAEPKDDPYKVKSPNQFWREEYRAMKADYEAEIVRLKEQLTEMTAECDKWRKTADGNELHCDRLHRQYWNEVDDHKRSKEEHKAQLRAKDGEIVRLNIGLAKAAGDVNRLKAENKLLRKVALDLANRVKRLAGHG